MGLQSALLGLEGAAIANPFDDNTKKTTKLYRDELYQRAKTEEEEKAAAERASRQVRGPGAHSRR